jgi:hypothetical protein
MRSGATEAKENAIDGRRKILPSFTLLRMSLRTNQTMNTYSLSRSFGVLLALAATALRLNAADSPASAIQDNSFFIEEAYNQEAGVVQHILTLGYDYTRRGEGKNFEAAFTQEWPFLSQLHQLSYTIPFSRVSESGSSHSGLGDVMLNYRLQALFEDEETPAFAPRISLILPSGNRREGLGNGVVGYQLNLPVSKIVHDRWTVHFNAGSTIYPGMRDRNPLGFHVGASLIYAVSDTFNLMLESLGDWSETALRGGNMERDFVAFISPGARYAFNLPNAQIVVGAAVPIGLSTDAPDVGGFLYCSYESKLFGDKE